jgi:hypothetical protein
VRNDPVVLVHVFLPVKGRNTMRSGGCAAVLDRTQGRTRPLLPARRQRRSRRRLRARVPIPPRCRSRSPRPLGRWPLEGEKTPHRRPGQPQ